MTAQEIADQAIRGFDSGSAFETYLTLIQLQSENRDAFQIVRNALIERYLGCGEELPDDVFSFLSDTWEE